MRRKKIWANFLLTFFFVKTKNGSVVPWYKIVAVAGALVGDLVQRRKGGGTFGKRKSKVVQFTYTRIDSYCCGTSSANLLQKSPMTWPIDPPS